MITDTTAFPWVQRMYTVSKRSKQGGKLEHFFSGRGLARLLEPISPVEATALYKLSYVDPSLPVDEYTEAANELIVSYGSLQWRFKRAHIQEIMRNAFFKSDAIDMIVEFIYKQGLISEGYHIVPPCASSWFTYQTNETEEERAHHLERTARGFFPKIDWESNIFSDTLIVFGNYPLNRHWVIFEVPIGSAQSNQVRCPVYVYDPLRNGYAKEVREMVKKFLDSLDIILDKRGWKPRNYFIQFSDCPQQLTGSVDCGPLSIMNALALVTGVQMTSDVVSGLSAPFIRNSLALSLLERRFRFNKTLLLEQQKKDNSSDVE